ncbi:hypothetical protein [Staphylococcus sp. NAM3COL9]|nr:hypothetical protein [Staphylococcus sp. NAM3COL9]
MIDELAKGKTSENVFSVAQSENDLRKCFKKSIEVYRIGAISCLLS